MPGTGQNPTYILSSSNVRMKAMAGFTWSLQHTQWKGFLQRNEKEHTKLSDRSSILR